MNMKCFEHGLTHSLMPGILVSREDQSSSLLTGVGADDCCWDAMKARGQTAQFLFLRLQVLL